MFRGTVDRAGTREGKKTSLRKTGKDKKGTSAEKTDEVLERTQGPIPFEGPDNSIVDCGGNLVNRHLEADSTRVISRAVAAGIKAMVIVTNDFEKSEASIAMCAANPGLVYAVVGVHPSNISAKKMSERLFIQLMQQLKAHAVSHHVVGLYAGLDYERDYGLKFPQEKFMKAQIALANEMNLPMVLQDLGNGDGLLEVMKESRKDFGRGMIYAYQGGSQALLQKYLDLDFYIGFNGLICSDTDQGAQLNFLISLVPRNRILLVSDAPNHTPQTIEDQFIREAKNEPSNLTYIAAAAAKSLKMDLNEFKVQVLKNSIEFYNLGGQVEEEPQVKEEAPLKTTTTTATKPATEEDEEDDDEDEDDDNELDKKSKQLLKDVKMLKIDKNSIQYCCKKCRTKLFGFNSIVEHEEQTKVLDHSSVKKKKDKTTGGCKSLFVASNKFFSVKPPSAENVKVECSKCASKLGSFSAGEEQCSCGKKEKGVCRIIKSRIEAILLDNKGVPIDISSLNLNSDDEDEDDDDDDDPKSKKKKKAKKTNIKKDNKRNLSSYRNKSDGAVSKKTSKAQAPPSLFENLEEDDENENEEENEDNSDN